MSKLRRFSLALVLGLLSLSSPAMAKKSDHNKHQDVYAEQYEQKDRHGSHEESRGDDRSRIEFRFEDERRDHIRGYLRESYRPHCPRGLAKKHNGCLPPGQAKHYAVGGHLPHTYQPVPQELLVRIGPPPSGTFYAMVDSDVLLVTEATKKILDAVTLLSAME